MKTCSFCSAESSAFDLFCGKCGRPFGEVPKGLPEVTKLSQSSMPVVTRPPLNNERNTDENQMVLPDVALPSVLAEQGQFPTGTAPEVQGTPHIENVPTVQGTPHVAGHSLLEQTTAQNPSSAATHAPQHLETGELQHYQHFGEPTHLNLAHQHAPAHPQQPITPSPHHYAPEQHQPLHQPQHYSPAHQPAQPIPSSPEQSWQRVHNEHQEYHTKPERTRRPHFRRHRAGEEASKTTRNLTTKWLIIILVIAMILIGAGGVVANVFAHTPSLTLSGSKTVVAGGILHLHGTGFIPQGTIALKLDNVLPIGGVGPRTKRLAFQGEGPDAADVLRLFASNQQDGQNATQSAIAVGINGAFDANVVTQTSWLLGTHTILAIESLGSRSASLTFTLLAQSAQVTSTSSVPTPSPTPTLRPSSTPTQMPTPTPTVMPTPSPTPTAVPTSTPTAVPTPTSPPSPTVIVQQVWTADSNNSTTTAFYNGEVIHYMVAAQNTSSTSVAATVTYLATGPQQIYYWSGSTTLASGPLRFYSAPTIPSNAPAGTYTITVTITCNGLSSQAQSQFTVSPGAR